ncbi:MAG: hypothetical protein R3348_09240, partial [Xanthomonadales bacterium]|nr:hypothetical protein [Xanthomonadales bacterium]
PGIAQGYFHPQGPAGTAIQAVQEQAGPISVGVVGLGVGALAALGRAGDAFVFYEIDPAVERLATDPSLFTYLSDAQADVSVDIGDGRLRLDASGARHDLLIIDAFSSDAIPAHLLTVEAFQLYRKVTGGGPVILHVSNRHLNLAPVVGATATAAGLQSWLWEYDPDLAALGTGARSSRWTALSADPDLGLPGWWEPIPTDRRPWTDDYSNIMGAIELRQ